jgi:hypothetical protein
MILDHRSRLSSNHDLVSRDKIAGLLEQHAEYVEGAGADFNWSQSVSFVPPEQAAPVEMGPLKQKNLGRGERSHASGLPAFLKLRTF